MHDVAITELLAEHGLGDRDAAAAGRRALEEAGLTRPGKLRIAAAKRDAVAAALSERLALSCAAPSCRSAAAAAAKDGADAIQVPPDRCPVCHGSANRRAVDGLAGACARAGVERVVVVGGSPDIRRELDALLGGSVALRLVDGTERRTGRQAADDLRWGQAVVVCGATELDHKVSQLYTRAPEARGRIVVASRRGVAAIADALAEHLARRASR